MRDSRGTEDGGMFFRGLSAEVLEGSFAVEGEPEGAAAAPSGTTASAGTVFLAALSAFSS